MAADGDGRAHESLTPRQHEVMEQVCLGRTNDAIARHLEISLHTVKAHLQNAYQRLGVETRAAAAAVYCGHRRRGEPGGGEGGP
ncbi:MAG: helix-turn-helix transcriptional regulator [Gemmatimonadota bacterium]|nr:helix-turn-helix transcriptional regulator [Gemmatimonadota bacterium]MDT8437333.1 helix-turn-helix transcriptional regulator [Gemmatimonadota bacterium]